MRKLLGLLLIVPMIVLLGMAFYTVYINDPKVFITSMLFIGIMISFVIGAGLLS